MPIHLISAILSENTGFDADGKLHIIEPHFGFDIPARHREGLKASGSPYALVHLPTLTLTLLLWGGEPGQEIHIAGAFGPVGEKKGTAILDTKITWQDKGGFRIKLNIEGAINFRETALYELRLLVDGEPLGVIPAVVRWDDETDI